MADKRKQKAQKDRLESYDRETQEEKAARVARERATEEAAAQALESLKTPFGIEIIYDPNDTETAAPADYLTGAALETANEMLQRANEIIKEQISEFVTSKDFDRITGVFPDAKQWTLDELERSPQTALIIITAVFYCVDYIPDYLRANNIKPSLSEFAAYTQNEKGEQISPLDKFLKYLQTSDIEAAANAGKEAAEEIQTGDALEIIARRPEFFGQPLDRVSDKIFNVKSEPDNGIVKMDISTDPKSKANPHPTFTYSIDFTTVESDLPFVKRLTTFDKSVCKAYGALQAAGNDVFTINQIFRTMGNNRNPTQKEKDAINESLTKMSARAHFDNKAEIAAGYKYKKFKYDGPFLAFERLTGVQINGKDTDTAIHSFRYPVVLQIAAERKQLQRIPMAALLAPEINRTEFTNQIEDVLLTEISNIKRGYQKHHRILYKTLYQKTGIAEDDRKKKTRLRNYTKQFLDGYKKANWITDYTADKEGVTITP